MKPYQWGLMFLASDAVLTYCLHQRAENPQQFLIMLGLVALAQLSFGCWLAGRFQKTLLQQREVVVGLQAESEKRQATLRDMQQVLTDAQKADHQQ